MRTLHVIPVAPVNAPGLLTSRGWDALRAAGAVGVSCAHPAWMAHLREAGVEAEVLATTNGEALLDSLLTWVSAAPAEAPLAWLVDSEHPYLPSPQAMLDILESTLANRDIRLDVDYVFASPVAPGAAVVESVRIMHELRSPGGDSWSAEQTHESLSRYLLEETYEVLDELESPERETSEVVGEFGDLLFQLVFHARLGMEAPEPWTLDSVARSLNEKMYRRNPHVFSPERSRMSVDEIVDQWENIKRDEKPRAHLSEGIPLALPALQRAFKIASRAQAAGRSEELETIAREHDDPLARALMSVVLQAAARDHDPESSLRALLRIIEREIATT